MLRSIRLRLLGALLLLPLMVAAQDVFRSEARVKAGDDPAWADPGFDDRAWTNGRTVPARSGLHWVRFRIRIPSRFPESPSLAWGQSLPTAVLAAMGPPNAVFMASPYSYELFWDGDRIGRSGSPAATRDEEKTGLLNHTWLLTPAQAAPGEHVVAIRLSTFHYNFPAESFDVLFHLVNHAALTATESRKPVFPLIGAGGALVLSFVSGALYLFVGRWRPLLLGSALAFALALFYFLIAWRWIENHPYEWFYPRLLAITWVTAAIAVILPWLLLEKFSVPRLWLWLVPLGPLLALSWIQSPLYEYKSLWICRSMLLLSLVITAWAAWRRRPGAVFVLLAIAVGLVTVGASRRDFIGPSFLLTVSLLFGSVFVSLGLQLRSERRRAHEAILTTSRLQTELLKKNIQPHFLLNTLATIMEVIEREPRTAVTLIEALAGEFRILARVSGEKLIPLHQELELCRAHLSIMSLRKGSCCSLQVEDEVDDTALVPPALFHTLIENGLTHLLPRGGELTFHLATEASGDGVRYRLLAAGRRQEAAELAPAREGTGLRYIRARLEESFPGRWSLAGGPVEGGWETVMVIPKLTAPAPARLQPA